MIRENRTHLICLSILLFVVFVLGIVILSPAKAYAAFGIGTTYNNNPSYYDFKYTFNVIYQPNGGTGHLNNDSVNKTYVKVKLTDDDKNNPNDSFNVDFTLPNCSFQPPLFQKFAYWKIGNKIYKPGDKIENTSDVDWHTSEVANKGSTYSVTKDIYVQACYEIDYQPVILIVLISILFLGCVIATILLCVKISPFSRKCFLINNCNNNPSTKEKNQSNDCEVNSKKHEEFSSKTSKLYCRKCGKEIPSDSTFCLYCGTEVEKNT